LGIILQRINTDVSKKLSTTVKAHKRQNKNAIKGIDLNYTSNEYFEGKDLIQIEGVSHSTHLKYYE
jgi:hypothetical protein